jgi:hypothetical protein
MVQVLAPVESVTRAFILWTNPSLQSDEDSKLEVLRSAELS